jgi:hypothetical protein
MSDVTANQPSEDEDFDIKSNDAAAQVTPDIVSTPPAIDLNQPKTEDRSNEFVEIPGAVPAILETASTTLSTASDVNTKVSNQRVKLARSHRTLMRLIGEGLLLIAVIVMAIMIANLQADKQTLSKQVAAVNANPQALVERQTTDLITRVGKLMQLPSGETPTVAAVSNAAAARQQSAFFDNARDGDKVLLYVKTGEAILYRPSTNKVILVAPLTFNNSTAGTTTSSSAESSTTK